MFARRIARHPARAEHRRNNLGAVGEAAQWREYGLRFDQVADAYDEYRPGYPEELVDAACEAAGLGEGDPVLEVGCGTGQLTAALVRRGLDVVAVEPGRSMIERARLRLRPNAAAFVRGRFEDVSPPRERFAAVFSATAFHWVDPQVSWAKVSSFLRPRGTLVLITYSNGSDQESLRTELELRGGLTAVAPEIASTVPKPREARAVLSGAEQRSANVSEAWSWICQRDLAIPEVAGMYDDVRIISKLVHRDWTAQRLNDHVRTTSLSFELGPERTAALEAETKRVFARLSGRVRLPELAVAVTTRRARQR